MLAKRLINLVPVGKKGDPVSFSDDDFKLLQATITIANNRTNRLALDLVLENINLREALSAAYLQGINDCQISKINAKGES